MFRTESRIGRISVEIIPLQERNKAEISTIIEMFFYFKKMNTTIKLKFPSSSIITCLLHVKFLKKFISILFNKVFLSMPIKDKHWLSVYKKIDLNLQRNMLHKVNTLDFPFIHNLSSKIALSEEHTSMITHSLPSALFPYISWKKIAFIKTNF